MEGDQSEEGTMSHDQQKKASIDGEPVDIREFATSTDESQEKVEPAQNSEHAELLARLARRWLTVEPVNALANMVMMTSMPITQQYIYRRLAVDYNITANESDSRCTPDEIVNSTVDENYADFHSSISQFNTGMMMAGLLPVIFTLVFIGSLADQVGRKVVLLMSLGSTLLMGVLTICVMQWDLPLYIILVASFLSGLTGGVGGISATCYAYVADLHTGRKRHIHLFIIEVLTGISALIGQIVVGYLIIWIDFVGSSMVINTVLILLISYTIIAIPETTQKKAHTQICSPELVKRVPRVFFQKRIVSGHRVQLGMVTLSLCLFAFAELGIVSIVTFYLMDPPVCWNSDLIGIYNGVSIFTRVGGGMLLMRFLSGRVPDVFLMLLGCVSTALSTVCLGMAGYNDAFPYIGCIVGFASMIVSPTMRNIASKLVKPEEQGALFAGLMMGQMLSMLTSVTIINYLYAQSSGQLHGFVFYLDASFFSLPIITIVLLAIIQRRAVLREREDTVNIQGDAVSLNTQILSPVENDLKDEQQFTQ